MQKQLQRTVLQKKCYALVFNIREKSSRKSSFFRKVTDCGSGPQMILFTVTFKGF